MSTLWNGIMLKSEHDGLIIKNQQEQIDALKAQVNCLREALESASTYREGTPYYGDPEKTLKETPEQCLAEVKAKAIEEALTATLNPDTAYLGYGMRQQVTENRPLEMRLAMYARQLREQAK